VARHLPKSKMLLNGVDVSEGPIFTVSEVAKIFFARTSHWVRWKDKEGAFVFEGEYVGGFRTTVKKGKEGARRYTLADVENMTHALAANDGINGHQMMHSLVVVKAIAEVWGFLEPEEFFS